MTGRPAAPQPLSQQQVADVLAAVAEVLDVPAAAWNRQGAELRVLQVRVARLRGYVRALADLVLDYTELGNHPEGIRAIAQDMPTYPVVRRAAAGQAPAPEAELGTPTLRQRIAFALARADQTGALGEPGERAHEYLPDADAVLVELGKDTRPGDQPGAGESTQYVQCPVCHMHTGTGDHSHALGDPAAPSVLVEFTVEGTVKLRQWHFIELGPDSYGRRFLQLGGWLPPGIEDSMPYGLPSGTSRLERAELPRPYRRPGAVNVQVRTRRYDAGRFMTILWLADAGRTETGGTC